MHCGKLHEIIMTMGNWCYSFGFNDVGQCGDHVRQIM